MAEAKVSVIVPALPSTTTAVVSVPAGPNAWLGIIHWGSVTPVPGR